jgi:O-antigen/teichoic acid export membrane protein
VTVQSDQHQLLRLVRGFAWIAASGLVGRIAGFGASILLAHILGPEAFGLVAVGVSIATVFSLCAGLGLDELLVRDIAREPYGSGSGTLCGDLLVVRLTAVPICIIGALALAAASQADAGLALGFGLYAVLNTYLLSACAAFRGQGQMRSQALLVGAQAAMVALCSVAVAYLVPRVDLVAVGYVVATGLAVAAAFALLRRTAFSPRFAWRPGAWVRLVRRGVPFAASGVGLLALDRAALLCIILVSGPVAAGWFGAAHTIVLSLGGLGTSAMMVAFPTLVRVAAADSRRFTSLVSHLVGAALVGGGALAVGLFALAPVMMPTLFGAEFGPSVAMLRAVAFSVPAMFVSLVLVGAFEASDRQAASAQTVTAAVPLAAAVCLGGTWTWGITAGAFAYSLAHVTLAGLLAIHWWRWQPAVRKVVLSAP